MGVFGDAWGWTKGAAGDIVGAFDDTFRQQTPEAYDPNRDNFQLGGRAGFQDEQRNRSQGIGRDYRTGGSRAQTRTAPQAGYGQANQDLDRYQRNQQFAQQSGQQGLMSREQNMAARQGQVDAANRLAAYQTSGPTGSVIGQQGPSAAQAVLQQGTDQAMAQALGMSRIGGGAAAQRAAMDQGVQAQQNANNQASVLRAQEDQAHRNQLLQQRSQDIGQASRLDQLRLQALGMEQGARGGIRQGDLGVRGQDIGTMGAYGQLGGLDLTARGQSMQGSQFNAGQQLQQQGLNDRHQLGMGQLGLGYENMAQQGDIANLRGGMGYENLKGGSFTQTQIADAGFDAQRDTGLIGGAAGLAGAAMLASDIREKNDISAESSISDDLAQSMMALGSGGQGGGGMLGGIMSDEDEKKRSLSYDLRPAKAYSYEYEDPDKPGRGHGRFVGPMAQDLEKTDLGNTLVRDTPDGKQIDAGRSALVGLSAISEQQRRMDDLEKRLQALGA